jgi:hypothetical protein
MDKVDELERYVFPQDKNAERDGSMLDENDEISFMASDTGDRAPSGFKPQGASAGHEIVLRDPLDNGVAWAYLFHIPGAAPEEKGDYISYALEGDKVFLRSPQYEFGWGVGKIYANHLRLLTPSGQLSDNLLDRQKIGLQARLAGERNLPIEAPESIIQAKDLAVIDGPVRVIINQAVFLRLANLDIKWGMEYFLKYYRCGQNNSVNFSFPTAANVFKTITMYWSLDFNDGVLGSRYVDPNRKDPLVIVSEPREGVPDDGPHYWWGLYGDNGAVFQALDLDDDILDYFGCQGRWRQDPAARDRKGEPGRIEIGFTCGETADIPEKKDYHWFNYILFPRNSGPEGLQAMAKLFEHPLQVSVAALP